MEAAEEGKIEGFDRRATIRDPRTGKTIKQQDYTSRVSQDGSEVLTRDGKKYWSNGVEIVEPPKPEVTPEPAKEAEPMVAAKAEKKPEVLFSKK